MSKKRVAIKAQKTVRVKSGVLNNNTVSRKPATSSRTNFEGSFFPQKVSAQSPSDIDSNETTTRHSSMTIVCQAPENVVAIHINRATAGIVPTVPEANGE